MTSTVTIKTVSLIRGTLVCGHQPLPAANNARRSVFLSSRSKAAVVQTPPKDLLPPPLPPSLSSKHSHPSPVEAKKRYLESKKRTEEFLKNPQKKIHQLQSEMDQVKDKLEKEVYNKSVWRRLTDPLKRKQHSLINMIAATFAYILAYSLHLKRQANKKLQDELQIQEQKVQDLKSLLQSLLEERYLEEIAVAISEHVQHPGSRSKMYLTWLWPSSSQKPDARTKSQEKASDEVECTKQLLRSKLQKRIGDKGLDDEKKKELNIQRIWRENEAKLQDSSSSDGSVGNGDDLAGLLALATEQEVETSSKPRRLFDM